MSRIAIYDPSDATVADRVTHYLISANTSAYDGEPNKLVNPDVTSLAAVPNKHWKYDGVSALVEMSQAEKDAVDAILAPVDTEHSPDGALRVKVDPGTATTDPKFYAHALTVPASSGDHWFDLNVPQDGTSRIQYVTVQVKDPVFGDSLEICFRSDGTDTATYGPLDTVVATFGGICPGMHKDAAGWGVPRKEPQEVSSSKLVPAGVKVSVKYSATDATGHELIVDTCCHE